MCNRSLTDWMKSQELGNQQEAALYVRAINGVPQMNQWISYVKWTCGKLGTMMSLRCEATKTRKVLIGLCVLSLSSHINTLHTRQRFTLKHP